MKPDFTTIGRAALLGLLFVQGAVLGATAELFRTIPAMVFNTDHPNVVSSSGHYARYCAGEECTFVADANLPHGATIVGLEIDACQNSPFWNLSFALLAVNTNESIIGGAADYSVEVESDADSGCVFTKAEAPVRKETNQIAQTYLVVVSVHNSIYSECGTDIPCPGFDSRFSAVRVFYEPNADGTVDPTKTAPGVVFP